MNTRLLTARCGTAILVTLVIAGCGGGQAATKQTLPPTTAPTSTSAGMATTEPPAVEEPTPTLADPGIAKVGPKEWFSYEDGLQVQVTKLARTTGGVIVTVTVKNGTTKTVDVGATTVNVSTGPNGDGAEQIFDMERNLGAGFTGSLPKGRSKTARFGFTVPAAHLGQIAVEVQPGFLDYESCHFEGAAK